MKSYLCDTNFILRFLLEDIPSQADIVGDYLKQAKEKKISFTVNILVFMELDFALTKFYKFTKEKVIESLKFVAELQYLNIEKSAVILAALNLYKENNISFVDAIFAAEANINGQELLTFDRKLKNLLR